ncbi:MAG: M1 family aminopeptidase, partial [Flavicella sp.]
MKLKYTLFTHVLLLFVTFGNAQINTKKIAFDNATNYSKEFELLHTDLSVSFDIPKELLFGDAELSVRPYFYDSDLLTLDAKGMTIKKVSMNSVPLTYKYDGYKLAIDLGASYSKSDTLIVDIKYIANPSQIKQKGSNAIKAARGLYFIDPKGTNPNKPTQIWTQGETESSSCWFPTLDSPNQKTSQKIAIRVPSKYKSLSNGVLMSQVSHKNGDRTDTWEMKQRHAPYLFFMGIGDFTIVKDSWRGKEVNYYVEPNFENVALDIFGKTPAMMDYFSEITGVDFMWDKYSQMVVRDFVSGAMENTTAVVHGERAYQTSAELIDENAWEPVIAHELFHHWFGDYVTAENWANLSLNESFATYGEYLWIEHAYGKTRAEAHRLKSVKAYNDGSHAHKKLVRYDYLDKEELFDRVSYNKGGAILHMLRNYIGDAAFFEGIQHYLKSHEYGVAEVAQLRMVFEQITGTDLRWFFEQWFYKAGHPTIQVAKDYNILDKTVTVSLKQQGEVFYFPIKITIYESGTIKHKEIFVDAREKSFTFSYDDYPDWIHVNSDHNLLADIIENKLLDTYKFQFSNAPHFIDRKNALEKLVKQQSDKTVFELVVKAFDDPYFEIQTMALNNIDLSYKYSKRKVIEKIEYLAKSAKNNKVRAAAVKVLGKLVYFDYQSIFEELVDDPSNAVKGAALEGLYYLDKDAAIKKAKNLPNSVKKTIAFPLSKIYIEQKQNTEIEFVANYIIQGMFLSNDAASKKTFKKGFDWVATSNNIEAYTNLTNDIVNKGNQYRKYNFHLEGVRLLRDLSKILDKTKKSNKKELQVL